MAKRANNEGTLYRRKSDGLWCAQISLPGGKRPTFYGKTRADAHAKLTEALRSSGRGLPVDAGGLTVGAFLDDWLENSVRPSVAPSTYTWREGQCLKPVHGGHIRAPFRSDPSR